MRQLVYAIIALLLLSSDAPAQERLNLAYISPDVRSASVLCAAKEGGIE